MKRLIIESEMFRGAGESKFLPNLLIAILLFSGLWIGSRMLAIGVITYPLGLLAKEDIISVAIARTIRLIIVGGANILAFFIWVKHVEKRPIHTMGFKNSTFLRKYLLGFVIGIALIAANTLIFLALGAIHFMDFDLLKQGIGIRLIISVFIMLLGYIVQSASEEIAVRGWLLPVIGAKYNAIIGVVLTSTMFGVLHLFNPNVTALSIINLVLSGIFLALMVLLQGNIWGACGYHCGWNWALANVFGYQISGYKPIGGSLLSVRIEGSELISGGYFGPEAGIIATIFLLAGIIALALLLYRKKTVRSINIESENVLD